MSQDRKPVIGISIGDMNGIGPEVIIKTFSNSKLLEYCTPVIFASSKVINFYKNIVNADFKFYGTKSMSQVNHKAVNVFNCWQEDVNVQMGKITPEGGKYAVRSLEVAVQCLKDKEIDALVTAPIDKHNVQGPNFNHHGHTTYLKEAFQSHEVAMILCTDFLRVALVTEHVPVHEIGKHLSREKIIAKAKVIHQSLIEDFGIDKPKIAVLALNPHAGDKGLIGKEESDIILPAIEELKTQNILAFGPFAADGFFARSHFSHYDCVLAMYHDQGLIPFKTLDRGEGVNFTAGLPIVRTSPDHGTAFDISGKNIADEKSFLHALYMAIDIYHQRKGYKTRTANKLEVGKWRFSLKKSKEDLVED